jgi:hypothetical protein
MKNELKLHNTPCLVVPRRYQSSKSISPKAIAMPSIQIFLKESIILPYLAAREWRKSVSICYWVHFIALMPPKGLLNADAGVAWRMRSFCLSKNKCPNGLAKKRPLAVKL